MVARWPFYGRSVAVWWSLGGRLMVARWPFDGRSVGGRWSVDPNLKKKILQFQLKMNKQQLVLLFGVTFCVGIDNQIFQWGSQSVNWFKLGCIRYGIRGLFAIVGGVLLATCVGNRFKDPPVTKQAWSQAATIATVVASAVTVTFAGYAISYLISQTPEPSVLSASLSVGILFFTLATGWLFFEEKLSVLKMCGVGLAIVSVVLMQYEHSASQPFILADVSPILMK